jgi:CSLREA domain-containing protein
MLRNQLHCCNKHKTELERSGLQQRSMRYPVISTKAGLRLALSKAVVRSCTTAMAGLLLTAAPSTNLQAKDFTVSETTDEGDTNLSDPDCNTSFGNGACTLRAAIQQANALEAQMPGQGVRHTIKLMPNKTYVLSIANLPNTTENDAATGDLDIKANLIITLSGPGAGRADIDGGKLDRIFDIHGTTVEIRDLTIRNGLTVPTATSSAEHGGGIRVATSTPALKRGNLTLDAVHVTNNESGGGFSLAGGGIDNAGDITLKNSSKVERNKAQNSCGGIRNSGTLTLTNSQVNKNTTAGNGGGICNTSSASRAELERCTISENHATSSTSDGGGIHNNGTMKLTNCTIGALNDARHGGAIYSTGSINLVSSTVTGNISSTQSGDIYLQQSAIATLLGTIINEGSAGCKSASTAASFVSEGYNIDRGTSCGLAAFDSKSQPTGNQSAVDPLLEAVPGLDGVYALQANSPAIDAVYAFLIPSTDQRGTARPQFPCPAPCRSTVRIPFHLPTADIGAHELIRNPYLMTLPLRLPRK